MPERRLGLARYFLADSILLRDSTLLRSAFRLAVCIGAKLASQIKKKSEGEESPA